MTVKADVTSTLNGQSADLILIEDAPDGARQYETKSLSGGSENFVFTGLDGGSDKEYTAKIVPSTNDVTQTSEVNFGATVDIDPIPHREADADSTIRETAEFESVRAKNGLGLGENTLLGGLLTSVIKSGEALADDGYAYQTIQAAQDSASSWVFVGEGTFAENVTIDTNGLTLTGVGDKSVIDGGSGSAITTSASDVTISNIAVVNSSGFCIENGNATRSVIDSVRFKQGTISGCRIAPEGRVSNCYFENMDQRAIVVGGSTNSDLWGVVEGNTIEGTTNDKAIQFANNRQNNVVANNIILNAGEAGLTFTADDSVAIGNRIHNSANDGIDVGGNDNIIANNRVSDSGGSDTSDSGSGNLFDSNNTGASN